MPKIWNDTVEAHRIAVREAIMDTTAALAFDRGPSAVTMSHIAERTGIGRATLYKYFPDVEAILVAWHERQIETHLRQLAEARDHAAGPLHRLEAVLNAYALIAHQRHDSELATLLHRGEHLARAQQHLREFVAELIGQAAQAGEVRDDVAPAELAAYCLHALTAAGTLSSKAAVHRLVRITLAGLRCEP